MPSKLIANCFFWILLAKHAPLNGGGARAWQRNCLVAKVFASVLLKSKEVDY